MRSPSGLKTTGLIVGMFPLAAEDGARYYTSTGLRLAVAIWEWSREVGGGSLRDFFFRTVL